MEDIPHIGRNMVKLIDCFVYLISVAFDKVDHDVMAERLSKSYGIRWTALDWLRSYLCYRPQTILFDWVISVLSAVVSLRAPCLDRCCSCSTQVSLLPLSAYLTSTFYTWGLHQQLHSSGVEWSLVLSEPPNSCTATVSTDCGSTPRRRTSYGVRPADGVSIMTPVSFL